MNDKHEVCEVVYLGPPKKWKRMVAGVFRKVKDKAPRGKAYKRMVLNGII